MYRFHLLQACSELHIRGMFVTSTRIRVYCDVPQQEASISLLRAYRQGLLDRRRARTRRPYFTLYEYTLTDKGWRRLEWAEREGIRS